MSGGHWDYLQHRLIDVVDDIREEVSNSGKEKTDEELKSESWLPKDWYKKYPEEMFHREFSDEVMKEFTKGAEIIEKAYIYMNRIDWLLSGDDGEDSFLRRLNEELNKLK